MRKFIKYLILILVIFNVLNAAVGIKNIKTSGNSLIFNLESTVKPKYQVNFDTYNRLLFIQIDGAVMNSKFNEKTIVGKNIEKAVYNNYGNSCGFFLTLKKGVEYKVTLKEKPYRLQIDFKQSGKKYITVAIDPGHGGKDPGAIGFKKYYEKDIVLNIGKYLQEELKNDFNIVMTRNTDKFITLSERSKIANRAGANLFVSLHVNASRDPKAEGMEVFYFSKKSSPYAEKIAAFENSFGEKYGEKISSIAQIAGELAYQKNMEKSISMAKSLNNKLAQVLKMRNRGIHGANFAVLRGFNGPALLVEVGFINNKNDIAKITKPANQKLIAKEIAKKIREEYLEK
jgi:N-acetylmuramoyl-L-alanine amidase